MTMQVNSGTLAESLVQQAAVGQQTGVPGAFNCKGYAMVLCIGVDLALPPHKHAFCL